MSRPVQSLVGVDVVSDDLAPIGLAGQDVVSMTIGRLQTHHPRLSVGYRRAGSLCGLVASRVCVGVSRIFDIVFGLLVKVSSVGVEWYVAQLAWVRREISSLAAGELQIFIIEADSAFHRPSSTILS